MSDIVWRCRCAYRNTMADWADITAADVIRDIAALITVAAMVGAVGLVGLAVTHTTMP